MGFRALRVGAVTNGSYDGKHQMNDVESEDHVPEVREPTGCLALEFLLASRLSSIFLQDPLPAMRTIAGRKSFQANGLPGQRARGPRAICAAGSTRDPGGLPDR